MATTETLHLFEHQRRGLARIHELHGRCGVFAGMGTGKTRMTLAYLEATKAKRILVVCPLSVTGVWEREARLIGFAGRVVDLTELATNGERAAMMRRIDDAVVLINYESYWREPLRTAILKWKPNAVVLDEIHRIRHRTTKHTRFAHVLADKPHVDTRLGLTGTPITNGLQDAWSIYRFIDRSVFPRKWSEFEEEYLRLEEYPFKRIVGYQNEDRARDRIAASSFQCPKEDANELPPRTDVIVPVRLTEATRRIDAAIKKDGIAELNNAAGEPRVALARIVLTLALRRQQISGGFTTAFLRDVTDPSQMRLGEEIVLGYEKTDAAIELIEAAKENGERSVVFCRFRNNIKSLIAHMPKGIRYATMTGDTSAHFRKQIQTDFQSGKYDTMLCMIQVASLGIDLSAASVGIFYSTGYNLDDFEQAKDRIHRTGQQRPVTYYHLLATDSIDQSVYEVLDGKLTLAAKITRLANTMREAA